MSWTNPSSDSLQSLFCASSVAVIGASSNPNKIGGVIVRNLNHKDFKGKIFPINPKADEIQGFKAYKNIQEVNHPIDLAIIVAPASSVEDLLRDCAVANVRSAIILTAGFSEVGGEGVTRQQAIASFVQETGMRVLGPNCVGMANFTQNLAASFHPSFENAMGQAGHIGIVSQSGAFAGLAVGVGTDRGAKFSYSISTGNEVDVDLADCLAFLADDPATHVIMAYMEGCRDGRKLIRALEKAHANRKPVIVIKLGRSEVGASAIQSHTAAMTGRDEVYESIFKRFGVYRAETLDEFFDVGIACAHSPRPESDKVGIITVSGGVGVLMADKAFERDLTIAEAPEALQATVKQMIPNAGVGNPIDITAQVIAEPEIFGKTVHAVLDSNAFSSIAVWHGRTGKMGRQMAEIWSDIRTHRPDLPLAFAGYFDQESRDIMQVNNCLVYEEPAHAIRTLGALNLFRERFTRDTSQPSLDCFEKRRLPVGALNEADLMELLNTFSIPVADEVVVNTEDDAVQHASRIDGPVVLKVVSSDIVHKSDVGGVQLNLQGEAAVRTAYRQIKKDVTSKSPQAQIEGYVVAPMAPNGTEVVLGVNNDPVFGPIVMFGMGGIFIEVLKDVTFRVAPFNIETAREMISEIRGYPLLLGARGRNPSDIDALADAVSRLSQFAAVYRDDIQSLDLNPFIVLPKGRGAVTVDARIIRK